MSDETKGSSEFNVKPGRSVADIFLGILLTGCKPIHVNHLLKYQESFYLYNYFNIPVTVKSSE